MRATAALALLTLAVLPAHAQMLEYEGPKSKQGSAMKALGQLMVDCPRFTEAYGDFLSIKLFAATPETPGLHGDLARMMEADTSILVSVLVRKKLRTLPAHTLRDAPGFTIELVASPRFSGMVVKDLPAQWLCNTAPKPGDPFTLLPSKAIGARLVE